MDRSEVLKLAQARIDEKPHLRLGQVIYAIMSEFFPDETNRLNASSIDPYYFDDRIPAFLDELGVV